MTVLLTIRYAAVWNEQEGSLAYSKDHVQHIVQRIPTIFLDVEVRL